MGRKGISIIAMLLAGAAAFPAHALGQAAPPAARTSAVPPLAFATRTLPTPRRLRIRDTSQANVSVRCGTMSAPGRPRRRSGFAHLFGTS